MRLVKRYDHGLDPSGLGVRIHEPRTNTLLVLTKRERAVFKRAAEIIDQARDLIQSVVGEGTDTELYPWGSAEGWIREAAETVSWPIDTTYHSNPKG